MELDRQDHRLYFEIHGPEQGQPVVLLHHGLGSVRAWKGQVGPLAKAGYRVAVYDRWGYGESSPRRRLSIPDFHDDQQDLLALMDCLDMQRPHLVGHSDGGTIALIFAARHPERIASVAAIAAHIYFEPKMEPGILGVRQAFETDPDFREGLRRVHGEKVEQVFFNWFNGWVDEANLDWDLRPELHRIACPALIVQGREDEHATPKHALDAMEAIPGAGLWIEPGVGHMLPQTIPEKLNQRLLEFWKGW